MSDGRPANNSAWTPKQEHKVHYLISPRLLGVLMDAQCAVLAELWLMECHISWGEVIQGALQTASTTTA
eukprot:8239197-Karenia_brevis.AAC.1